MPFFTRVPASDLTTSNCKYLVMVMVPPTGHTKKRTLVLGYATPKTFNKFYFTLIRTVFVP